MFYDLYKILKRCLKFWYIFALTIAVCIPACFLFVKPLKYHSSSYRVSAEFLDKKAILDKYYDLNIYDDLNMAVLGFVVNNYAIENEREIEQIFSINKSDFIISLMIIGGYKDREIFVSVATQSDELSSKIKEYIKGDLLIYINEIATIKTDVELQQEFKYYIVDEGNETSVNNNLFYSFIVVCMILILEVFVIGLAGLRHSCILSDSELQTVFKSNIIMKDYNLNLDDFNVIIKTHNKLNNKVMLLTENTDFVENVLKKHKWSYANLDNINSVKDFENIEERSFVIEVVKGRTKNRDIVRVMDLLRTLNFENIYFITRGEVGTNESSSNK